MERGHRCATAATVPARLLITLDHLPTFGTDAIHSSASGTARRAGVRLWSSKKPYAAHAEAATYRGSYLGLNAPGLAMWKGQEPKIFFFF